MYRQKCVVCVQSQQRTHEYLITSRFFFPQCSQLTESMLSVVKEVQGGFSFCGAAKMLMEDSTKGIQICEDEQEKWQPKIKQTQQEQVGELLRQLPEEYITIFRNRNQQDKPQKNTQEKNRTAFHILHWPVYIKSASIIDVNSEKPPTCYI